MFGLATGHLPESLAVGLFYELFWVDLFPAGTYIPPQGLAAVLSALVLVRLNGLEDGARILPVLILCLPMATFGARLEQLHRIWQDKGYSRLLRASRRPSGQVETGRVLILGVLRLFCVNALFFVVGTTLLQMAYIVVNPFTNSAGLNEHVTWPALWFAASLGGVLSLRWRRSYGVMAFCTVALAAGGYLLTR